MKLFALAATSALALIAAASPAAAATIYDNGAPNGLNGNEMSQWVQAETFTLATAETIRSVSFQAFTPASLANATLQYWVFSNASGTPGTILATGAAQNLMFTAAGTVTGIQTYNTSFDIASGYAAAANTTYFLGLRIAGAATSVYWGATAANGTATGRESFGGTFNNWQNNLLEHSFSLSNAAVGAAVPEPATWGLMLLGMGMVGAAMRSRRRTTVAYA